MTRPYVKDRLSGIRRKCLILIFNNFFSRIELIHFTAAHALNFDVP